MADVGPEGGFIPSLLDRLVASNPGDPVWRTGYSLDRQVDSVRRDLEDLLNTHQSRADLPPSFVELAESVFTYGMPDASSLSAMAVERRDEICLLVASLVARFEPRLREIRVRPADPADFRSIRLMVEARLHLEPFPEVEFETVLELTTGRATIRPAGD